MIIQGILIAGLLVALLFAVAQRGSRLIGVTISVVSIAGVYFVLFPESTNVIANAVGVGRGADLVLYCWLVISLITSLGLQFKLLRQHEAVTELARELALLSARAERGATNE